MSLRRTLNLLRVFFLGLCIAAIGARVAWTKFPEQVDRVDHWIVKTAEHRVRREIHRAQNAKEAGNPEVAVEHLLKVARSTDETKHGDRLEGLRQTALTSLRDEYRRLGQLEESLRWANELHELNERNTFNELARAKLLGELGLAEESLALFARLDDLTEGRAEFQLPYFDELICAGAGTEALELLLRMKEGSGLDVPLNGWELRHRVPGTAWSEAVSIDLMGPGVARAQVEFEVPAEELREIRVDVPRGASVIAKQLRIALLLSGGAAVTLDLANLQRLNQLEAIEGGFRGVSMSDPYVVLDVPALPEGATVVGASLEFELFPVMPKSIDEFLKSELGADALEELEARHEDGCGSELERARLQKLKEILHG